MCTENQQSSAKVIWIKSGRGGGGESGLGVRGGQGEGGVMAGNWRRLLHLLHPAFHACGERRGLGLDSGEILLTSGQSAQIETP